MTTFATAPDSDTAPGAPTENSLVLWTGTPGQNFKGSTVVTTDAGAITCAGISSTGEAILAGVATIGASGNADVPNFRAPKQTTVGSAGAASALPAAPTGYLEVKIQGVAYVIPFYAKS
jgi:hypothetical protein